MKVNEIITPDPKCISPDASLAEAAQQMKLLDVGMLPVCENDRLVGTITDRDITVRAVAKDLVPHDATVGQVMTREIVYCLEDENIKTAALLMEERQIRRLPVLNRDKRLVGILSLGDLAIRTGKEKLAGQVLERVSEPGQVLT